jgi:RNA polymerase sigma factor (sigma-70 family)
MQEPTDAQLLRDYAEHHSEAAFRELVSRHTDVVYASALRQVSSPDLAHDIAQTVFTDLARKAQPLAGTLSGDASLLGWLYRSTRFLALNQLRDDRRRQARERQAMENFNPASETTPEWERMQPVLDEAMADLSDEDRDALLLRFFKNRDFRAIGTALGVSDDAAQKRVSRALERLRIQLTSRGVTTTAVALSTVLSTNAVPLAPAGLAATLSTAALAGTTLAATAAAAAAKTIAMTTLQKTVIAVALTAAIGTGIYEARQAASLRSQVQTLKEQQTPLSEQIQQLQGERDDATNRLTMLADELARVKSNNAELLKLRGEINVLRRQLASENAKAVQHTTSSTASRGAVHKPGSYISKDQLLNAGFDTAEAATETYFHAEWSGDFQQFTNALSARLLAELDALNDPEMLERTFREQKEPSGIQGIQLLAKKVSDDRVDVQVLIFKGGKPPEIKITQMVKEGTSWKFDDFTSNPNWQADWRDGHFETLTPTANQ